MIRWLLKYLMPLAWELYVNKKKVDMLQDPSAYLLQRNKASLWKRVGRWVLCALLFPWWVPKRPLCKCVLWAFVGPKWRYATAPWATTPKVRPFP